METTSKSVQEQTPEHTEKRREYGFLGRLGIRLGAAVGLISAFFAYDMYKNYSDYTLNLPNAKAGKRIGVSLERNLLSTDWDRVYVTKVNVIGIKKEITADCGKENYIGDLVGKIQNSKAQDGEVEKLRGIFNSAEVYEGGEREEKMLCDGVVGLVKDRHLQARRVYVRYPRHMPYVPIR